MAKTRKMRRRPKEPTTHAVLSAVTEKLEEMQLALQQLERTAGEIGSQFLEGMDRLNQKKATVSPALWILRVKDRLRGDLEILSNYQTQIAILSDMLAESRQLLEERGIQDEGALALLAHNEQLLSLSQSHVQDASQIFAEITQQVMQEQGIDTGDT